MYWLFAFGTPIVRVILIVSSVRSVLSQFQPNCRAMSNALSATRSLKCSSSIVWAPSVSCL